MKNKNSIKNSENLISGLVLEISGETCLIMDRNMLVYRALTPENAAVGSEITTAVLPRTGMRNKEKKEA